MERLKGPSIRFRGLLVFLFTFQYGEIKSLARLARLARTHRFTFQYGEIKSQCADHSPTDDPRFTFQYGEIKSCCRCNKNQRLLAFTFQYGEIKRLRHRKMQQNGMLIYIPVWRD